MASAKDGVNPARQGGSPARQDPSPARQGRADGLDPTNQSGQTPSEIFGFGTHLDSTGIGGSGSEAVPSDVTLNKGQLDEVFSHTGPSVNTHTGVAGSEGAHNGNGGPDSVTYTDPWALIGGVTREQHVSAHIDGPGDWTQANDQGYSGGPTLPTLQNTRPTSTGLGSGHVSSHKHPDAGK
jgi:hypothetical protein